VAGFCVHYSPRRRYSFSSGHMLPSAVISDTGGRFGQLAEEGIGRPDQPAHYAIRNMLATPNALYIGAANPMNLLTLRSDLKPEGGWEL
jgi:hypothetical protein